MVKFKVGDAVRLTDGTEILVNSRDLDRNPPMWGGSNFGTVPNRAFSAEEVAAVIDRDEFEKIYGE